MRSYGVLTALFKLIGKYLFNVLISIDQFGNALSGGDPDETISSRIGKIKLAHKGKIPVYHPLAGTIDYFLDRIDRDHSIEAIETYAGEDACLKHKHKPMKMR